MRTTAGTFKFTTKVTDNRASRRHNSSVSPSTTAAAAVSSSGPAAARADACPGHPSLAGKRFPATGLPAYLPELWFRRTLRDGGRGRARVPPWHCRLADIPVPGLPATASCFLGRWQRGAGLGEGGTACVGWAGRRGQVSA